MNINDYIGMAKFSLTESEQMEISVQASKLIDSFGLLQSINTDDIGVLFTVLDIKNVFRDDVVAKEISKETILSNAPEQYGGYFQVPKTLD